MNVNMEIKVLTVFIIIVNILIIIYYFRNIPGASRANDHMNVVKNMIKKRHIKIRSHVTNEGHVISNLRMDNIESRHNNKSDIEMTKIMKAVTKAYSMRKDKETIREAKDKETLQRNEIRISGEEYKHDAFVKIGNKVFVYSAYYDERKDRNVRLVSIAATKSQPPVLCIFKGGLIVNSTFYKTCEDHGKMYAAYLISCRVPDQVGRTDIREHGVTVVSRSGKNKEYSHLSVNVPASSKPVHDFSVCVPPLYGNLSKPQLIEFIEISKILGANHFTFYIYDVDESIVRLLKSYGPEVVDLRSWSHMFPEKILWYKGQSASIWDCLFNNMYSSHYIVFNDIDEYIVPRISDNWKTMMRVLNRKDDQNIAGYRFRSVVFDNSRAMIPPSFSDETKNYQTLGTIIRNKQGDIGRSKMIIDPRKVLELGIHHLSKALEDRYFTMNVKMDIGLIHHYRKFENPPIRRRGDKTPRDRFIEDYTMWRFRDTIINAIRARMSILKKRKILT